MPVSGVTTLLDVLQAASPGGPAIFLPEHGIGINYDCLRKQVLAMADALAAAGIRPGDRVATLLPNGLPAIVSFLAASIAGTAAPLNPGYKYDEVCFYLEDTNARVLLCPPKGAEEARKAAQERGIPVYSVAVDSGGGAYLVDASTNGHSFSAPSPEDVALILHTSGSTGRPKRVPLRHCNLATSARNVAATYSLTTEDVALCVMPLFHVHGLVASTLATLVSGGAIVVPTKFNPLSFSRLVRQYRVTWYSAVPTIHQLLLARAGTSERPEFTGTLRFIRSASTPLSPEVMHKMESLFDVPLLEAYGMTEAAHQMASNPLPPRTRKAGSVGRPTGCSVSIIDCDGNHLGEEQRGEVVIRGPNVFCGYENNPDANEKCFIEGWFRTGDEGFIDLDGYLHLTGRLKEMINRAGEKIAPREIDRVLMMHPAVAEAVTFGFPHPTWGEEVAAAVVLHEPETEAALLKFCRQRLAEFKCPKKLYFVDAIPQTATGKIRRSAVATVLVGKTQP